MRQSSLHLAEDLGVCRIATKIMIKFAGAVVVAGSSRQQVQTVGQGTQLTTNLGIMILMIDLDAI